MNDLSKFWQISVNGATPQTFAQKFFHNVRRELRHTDLDRLTFVAGGRAIDATPLMNYGDAVAVTRNGKPFFAGTALPPRLVGRPNEENHLYTVVSPWYDLTRTFYQQEWTVWDGTYVNEGGLLVPHTVTEYLSTLVLFMQQNGSLLTAQAQITDAINFAIGHGMSAEIQLGTVDMNFQPPIDIIKGAITCRSIATVAGANALSVVGADTARFSRHFSRTATDSSGRASMSFPMRSIMASKTAISLCRRAVSARVIRSSKTS